MMQYILTKELVEQTLFKESKRYCQEMLYLVCIELNPITHINVLMYQRLKVNELYNEIRDTRAKLKQMGGYT